MPELIRSPSPQGEGVRKRPSTRGEGAGDAETLDSGLTIAVYVDPVESARAAGLRCTWGGTVLMLSALLALGACDSEREANKAVVQAVKQVAENLGNRPAICRKYYIHPVVIDTFVQGELVDALAGAVEDSEESDETNGLRNLEAGVLALLRGRALTPGPSPASGRGV